MPEALPLPEKSIQQFQIDVKKNSKERPSQALLGAL
ncbi:Uncharacterised protein [Citrobacter braakii]|nr:Uncharacterised protein [Citrobacter braakii]STH92724.1 Uncharacterised protein [Citrobacter braakii]SUX56497.1 Uncharacterised protein [Citrobacter braakii]